VPPTNRNAVLVHVGMASVSVLFALNYIFSKFALGAFHPFSFAYLRVLGAAIILNLLLHDRAAPPLTRDDRWRVVLYAFLGVVVNQGMFLLGLSLTSAHVAAILITTVPVFALAAAIGLGRERGTVAKMGGIILAACGALSVVGGERIHGDFKSLIGDSLILVNSLSYAIYLVLSKPMMTRLSPRRVIARMFAAGAVMMLPMSAVPMLRQRWSSVPPRAWIALALVIAGPTVAAYVINAWTLRHADASLVATYTYLQPVITVVLAAVFLGEHIKPVAIFAAVLIFAGVWLAGRPAPPAATEEAVPGSPD